VSRRKRRELMLKKKGLKGKEGYDGVFVGDDLTPLRSRLLGTVKRLERVERAWCIDGRVHTQLKSPVGQAPHDKPIIIRSPDDLFRLGVDHVDYAALGLPHLAFGEVAGGDDGGGGKETVDVDDGGGKETVELDGDGGRKETVG
jgi:hypothetical protein